MSATLIAWNGWERITMDGRKVWLGKTLYQKPRPIAGWYKARLHHPCHLTILEQVMVLEAAEHPRRLIARDIGD